MLEYLERFVSLPVFPIDPAGFLEFIITIDLSILPTPTHGPARCRGVLSVRRATLSALSMPSICRFAICMSQGESLVILGRVNTRSRSFPPKKATLAVQADTDRTQERKGLDSVL